jgi:hypothetical protein
LTASAAYTERVTAISERTTAASQAGSNPLSGSCSPWLPSISISAAAEG